MNYINEYRRIFPEVPPHDPAVQEIFLTTTVYRNRKYDISVSILLNFLFTQINDVVAEVIGGNDLVALIAYIANIENTTCQYSGLRFPPKLRKTPVPTLAACSKDCKCRRDKISEVKKNMTDEQRALREKRYQETMMATYGVRNAVHSTELVDKMKASLYNRSDEEKTLQKKRRLETCIDRYGSLVNAAFTEKRQETLMERYGVIHNTQIPGVIDKIKKTNLERYGVENTFSLPHSKERYKRSMVEQRSSIRDKKRVLVGYSQETIDILNNKELFSEFIKNKSTSTACKALGISQTAFYGVMAQYEIPACQSSYENEIRYFLIDNGVDFMANTRKIISPLELDFYIPSHKLGIEFNGIYWHSSLHKANDYHQKKYLLCREAGIRLIMINEDEWNHNPEIIKSKILNILGMSERGVGARKLSIRSVGSSQANDFFDRHHIQGRTGSILSSTGAFLDDQLVSCMSFNKQRGTDMIELIRYATDGRTYAGAFSRLFRHAVEQNGYDEVISFADLRYSDGAVYRSNGFELVRTIAPDYRYVFGESTYHKSSFTKKNIEKKFGIDMTGLTERVVMEMLEIPRLYDCGKVKYRWVRSQV